jgi:hypothetical protein
LPTDAWLSLALFMALVLSVALHGLAASGHFPRENRPLTLDSSIGRLTLYGSMTISTVCLLVGATIAWRMIPWYAAVIGGGTVVLGAPSVLGLLSNRVVNGSIALIVFSGMAILLAIAMTWIAFGGHVP